MFDVLLMLVGALLGIATNYATDQSDHVPLALRLLQDWSVPLIGVALALLVGGQIALHLLDRPPPARRLWNNAQPPYPGLEAFTEDDAAVFFGRDRVIAELIGRLHPVVPGRAQRFVTVIGPSGSGKSSLVRAGLLPALARRRGRWAVAVPFSPGEDPVGTLQRRLAQLPEERPALLVIDQLEELLTLASREERNAFLTAVRDALRRDARLWMVATLRSDFLTGFLESGFAELVRDPAVVGALARDTLHEVIKKPAEQAGLTFAPGVVARMVDECGGGDALPLLAYTLQELYLRAGGSGGTVTEEAYRALGGIAGALSERADQITGELADAPVIPTLLRFVTIDRNDATRRRVRRGDLTPREQEVADAFVAGRLLTGDGGVLDVAHEALFRQWAPLRQAVVARAEDLRRRTELERWAQDWDHAERQDAYLLTGERLSVARRWLAQSSRTVGAPPLVEEFVDRSLRADGPRWNVLRTRWPSGSSKASTRSRRPPCSPPLRRSRSARPHPARFRRCTRPWAPPGCKPCCAASNAARPGWPVAGRAAAGCVQRRRHRTGVASGPRRAAGGACGRRRLGTGGGLVPRRTQTRGRLQGHHRARLVLRHLDRTGHPAPHGGDPRPGGGGWRCRLVARRQPPRVGRQRLRRADLGRRHLRRIRSAAGAPAHGLERDVVT